MRKKKKGLEMTLAEADVHQRTQFEKGGISKRGFPPLQQAVDETLAILNDQDKAKAHKLRGAPRKMNQTEKEYSIFLEARKTKGEIVEYCYEGVRLIWGDCMVYKADFTARRPDGKIELHEVKGAKIWDRDIVRFKGCRAEWKEWFIFELHQKNENKQWNRLL